MSAPAVNTPADVADLRVWIADQWSPGRAFAQSAAALHASRSMTASDPVAYARHERHLLHQATLWWVAEDMVELLLASAATVPDDLTMADLPPMPAHGLVVFATPWWGIDADRPDRQVQVDAMLWGPARLPAVPHRGRPEPSQALSVCTYRRVDFDMGLAADELTLAVATGAAMSGTLHPIDSASPELREAADRMLAVHSHPETGQLGSIGTEPTDTAHGTVAHAGPGAQWRMTGQAWVPLGRSDWPLDTTVGQPPWDGMPAETVASMVEDRKVIAALWVLLHQSGIAQTEVHHPPKPTVRRTQRAGLPRQLAEVQVVRLRKLDRTDHAPEGDEHAKREYTHRWLVAGHWRWQPCGPGRAQRRLTYVRPHVKGPEGKPLHVPTRVNAFVR